MFPQIDPTFLEEILYALILTFMGGAGGNAPAARQAALAALAAYDPQNEQELRLAAQITQYSFASLDAMARSIDPDLPLNTVLRLRGNANALQRSANQCQRTLDRLRKERRQAEQQQPAAAEPTAQPAAPAAPDSHPQDIRPQGMVEPGPRTRPDDPPSVRATGAECHAPAPDANAAATPHFAAYAEEGTVPWESMFLPMPPDDRPFPTRSRPAPGTERQPALRPAA